MKETVLQASNQNIIILGMHRSGTSLVAELVHRWGASGDEDAMVPGDIWNPRGYREFAPLMRLNDELLGLLQSRWNVPPDDTAKSLLHAMAQEPNLRRRALDLVSSMQRFKGPWFWKDPRLSILLPFWKQLWGDVVYLIPLRDPAEIAQSLARRDGLPARTSFAVWHRYMSEIVAEDQVRSTGIFLSYEDLIADPKRGAQSLCSALDSRFGTSGLGPEGRSEHMSAAIDSRLHRCSGESPFETNPLATDEQKRLYKLLLDYTKEDSSRQREHVATVLAPQWREAIAIEQISAQTGATRSACQVYWRTSDSAYSEDRSRSVAISMDSTPQSIRIPIGLPDDSRAIGLRIDLADRPACVWVKALSISDAAGDVLWTMDNEKGDLAGMVTHEIGLCQPLQGENGFLLRLDGYDPWLEVLLDIPQGTMLSRTGFVVLQGTYIASLEQMLLSHADEARRAVLRIGVLESQLHAMHCESANNLEELRSLRAAHQELHRESSFRFSKFESEYADLMRALDVLQNERPWGPRAADLEPLLGSPRLGRTAAEESDDVT